MINNLTEAQQKYLEVIYELSKEHSHAHVKNIADRLNISMPTVCEALQILKKLKLINHRSRQPVTLTQKGKELAEILNNRHQVIYKFLSDILAFDKEYSEEVACKLEHFCEDEIIVRIYKLINFLEESSIQNKTDFVKKFTESFKKD